MKLIKRDIANELITMSKKYPVLTILGPRQSGKTTLVKQIFHDKPYVSLENIDERNLADADPKGFLAKFPNGAILDEIQRQPTLLSYIQGIVDSQDKKGMFVLTGSHQLSLHETISQSLAGRTCILKLWPLTIHELAEARINLSTDEYLLHGMYPRPYKDKIEPTKFFRDYVLTYVERDLRQIINVKDLLLFQKFLKLCAGRTGQIFNSHNLTNETGVSYHSINNWLSALEASFITIRLQPYFENFGKRVIKSPKLYFTDVGVASYLLDITSTTQVSRDPLRGNLFENFVILELIKNSLNQGIEQSFYFYRDSNNNEVDLIIKSGNNLIPIEIKASQTFNPSFLNGLKYFDNLTKRAPMGFLVYAGKQEQKIDKYHVINYTNVHKILSYIKNEDY